jgi:hypothetical protein
LTWISKLDRKEERAEQRKPFMKNGMDWNRARVQLIYIFNDPINGSIAFRG